MKPRTFAVLLAAALVVAGVTPGPAGAKKKKKAGPVVVGTDPDNDWGANVDPTIYPMGDAMGQELVEASIEKVDPKTINFVIKVKSLPPNGGVPEATRYVWDFTVGEEAYDLDGKWTNYSRGACDPTSGQCPPPRDPGMQPFLLRGDCGPDPVLPLNVCRELAKIQATFDVATGTITIPVPIDAIKAKPGAQIVGISSASFAAPITAISAAYVSQASAPLDYLITTKAYVVPK